MIILIVRTDTMAVYMSVGPIELIRAVGVEFLHNAEVLLSTAVKD